jgi:hypothetical protein
LNALAWYRPEFLWALSFLGAALAIHLLKRRKTRRLDFSTLRFFKEEAVRATRIRRLRNLLLLLIRLLAIAAVVALFARPFNKSDSLNALHDPACTIFVWIDRTPSMDYGDGGVSLLGKAAVLVDSVRRTLPSSGRLLVYDESRREFQPVDNSQSVVLKSRHGPPGLAACFRAWNADRNNHSQPVLLLFSDFQKSTTDLLDSGAFAGNAPVVCVTLAPKSPWNYSIVSSSCRNAIGALKASATVAAQSQRLDSGMLNVTIGEVRVGAKSCSVRPGDTATVEIAAGSSAGRGGGAISLAASDPLQFDNTSYFTTRERKSLRVVIVGDVERSYPVAAAFGASGERRFSPVTVRESEAVGFDELDSADVVVLNGIARPSRVLEAFLNSRESGEKTVMCAIGADEEGLHTASMLLGTIGSNTAGRLNLVKLEKPVTFSLPDTISDLWKGFRSPRITEAAIYRYVKGFPGEPLLRYDDGVPFCTKAADRQGRTWLLFSTPIGVTDANNLCETGVYVPLLDRLTRFADGTRTKKGDSWVTGFERRNPFYGTGRAAEIFDEQGKFLERWQSQPSVLFKQPGIYRIAPEGQATYWIAVSADPAESNLAYVNPVAQWNGRNLFFLDGPQFREALHGGGRLLSYLPWFVLAILLFTELFFWESARAAPTRRKPLD